jgi:hypothetical protein
MGKRGRAPRKRPAVQAEAILLAMYVRCACTHESTEMFYAYTAN